MDDRPKTPLSHKRRSGSETRQKECRISPRVTPEEYRQVETAAAGAGLTLASYVRQRLIQTPQTRSRRRPHADVAALARTLGELNRVGSNINQVARRVNLGDTPLTHEIHDAMAGLQETLAAIREALGLGRK